MRSSVIFLTFLFSALAVFSASAEPVSFKAADGLEVSADLNKGSSPVAIVLFHQAGSSHGEYKTIAPRLQKLGYTTLAVDQRSGGQFSGVRNETAKRAAAAGKGTSFLDARPDMEAAVSYARALPGIEKVVIWGSSYSAALSLVIAGQKTARLDGVLSFSPGEYLSGVSVEKAAGGIAVPAFISSAKSEVGQWQDIHAAIPAKAKAIAFRPKGSGQHGSSALITGSSPNAEEYWGAVEAFLKENF